MSEKGAEKTEEATEKKTSDALGRGEGPIYKDAVVAFGLLGAIAGARLIDDARVEPLVAGLAGLLSTSGQVEIRSGGDAAELGGFIFTSIGAGMSFMFGALMIVPVIGSLIQGQPRIVFKRIRPDFGRISPRKHLARTFGAAAWIELVKSAVKVAACAGSVGTLLYAESGSILNVVGYGAKATALETLALSERALIRVFFLIAFLAVIDAAVARIRWKRNLKMSRQELKEEVKESEGNPHIKSRLRSVASSRIRRRMIRDVEHATIVVANPVHYAVALKYVHSEGGAPKIVAKGQELIAIKIKARAKECGVPIVENPPLARALFDKVEIGQMIPPEFYRAIADIINFIAATGVARN